MTSAFISKPLGGWLHSDKLISREGATYAIRVSDTKSSQYCYVLTKCFVCRAVRRVSGSEGLHERIGFQDKVMCCQVSKPD